jgi:hypothetical protein
MTKVVSKLSTWSKRFIKCVILVIDGLVIFCIGCSCLQWQLKSYKTSEATVMLGLLHLKNKKGGIVRASRPCLCEWVPGLVRKLQGTEAKASKPDCACVSWHLAFWERSKELRQRPWNQTVPVWVGIWLVRKPDIQKNSIQGSQMASCLSDVNNKVMLTVCFFCFSVPILKEP